MAAHHCDEMLPTISSCCLDPQVEGELAALLTRGSDAGDTSAAGALPAGWVAVPTAVLAVGSDEVLDAPSPPLYRIHAALLI